MPEQKYPHFVDRFFLAAFDVKELLVNVIRITCRTPGSDRLSVLDEFEFSAALRPLKP